MIREAEEKDISETRYSGVHLLFLGMRPRYDRG